MGEIARLMTSAMSEEETAALVEEMTPLWTRTPDRVLRSSMERVDRADVAAYVGFLRRADAACRRRGSAEAVEQIARRVGIARDVLRRSATA